MISTANFAWKMMVFYKKGQDLAGFPSLSFRFMDID